MTRTPAETDPQAAVAEAAPPIAGELALLPVVSPTGGPWGPSPVAWFRDKLWLAGPDRIYSAEPTSRDWTVAHRIPMRTLEASLADTAEKLGFVEDGPAAAAMQTEIPGSFGIGPLTVLQAPKDRSPCLYAVARSLWGARILRSSDGRDFDEIKSPPGLGTASRIALAGLAVAGPWLVTAPAPVEGPAGKTARLPLGEVTVFAASGAADDWMPASAPGFGADVFGGITALAAAHGRIYAAVEDVYGGFQLWSAEPGDNLPWQWTRVIDRGGYRYSLAPRVTAMRAFGDALYLASAVSETGFGVDRAGPAAAELLRVGADGRWDVIVGAPRFSPDGFKVPLSGSGPGFGDPFTTAILSLVEIGGVLFAGTRNARAEYRLWDSQGKAPEARPTGAPIWASRDGETWQAAQLAGHDDPRVTAIRALMAGPDGIAAAVTVNKALTDALADPPRPFHDDDLSREDIRIWM